MQSNRRLVSQAFQKFLQQGNPPVYFQGVRYSSLVQGQSALVDPSASKTLFSSSSFTRWFSSDSNRSDVADSRLNRALNRAKQKQQAAKQPGNQIQLEQSSAVAPAEAVASSGQISSVVSHPALVITRDIEWGTVLLGYEQCNKYVIYDQSGQVVGLMAEDHSGIGGAVGRQLLRTRRSFTATVFSPDGSQVIFRVRRPMYLINSSMYVEDGEGNTIGEIQQRFHLLKRNYDLYLDKRQFAQISGNFLAWEFELKDNEGGTLALIDRNFSGFAKEIFTDAGKYVIHFGSSPEQAAQEATNTIRTRANNPTLPPVTTMAKYRTGVEVIPTTSGDQLAVSRPLSLTERQIALACAITIDFDYFSQHSHTSGWITPPLIIPTPVPSPGGAEGGPDVGGDVAGGTPPPFPPSQGGDYGQQGGSTVEGDLGGDQFPGDDFQQEYGQQQQQDSWGWGGNNDDGGGDGGNGGGWGQIGEVLQDVFGIGDE
eukprot:TRINITY_DN6776_c0_g2_i12.p1 TRINITY_DN6776_c0_g2~~TRINITY_DN6776_c0_g2_i12.p1  ORF type:complete len:483 (+),score=71.66 TRINITY_DN6776_c0_g2_i12:2459-3907(+)